MTCGCSKSAAARDRQRSAAVMCILCPEREGDTCGLTGLTVERAVLDGGCVHHPDAAGVVRWAGLRWYGVPMPLRWLLRLLTALRAVRPLSGPLTGCGCLVALKDRWTAWRDRRVAASQSTDTPECLTGGSAP